MHISCCLVRLFFFTVLFEDVVPFFMKKEKVINSKKHEKDFGTYTRLTIELNPNIVQPD